MPLFIVVCSCAIGGCQTSFGDETGAGPLILEAHKVSKAHGTSEMLADPTGEEPRASHAQIENIYWRLVSLHDRPVLPGLQSQVYMRLRSQENRMEGFGGCNRVRAQYEADEGGIRFSNLTATRKVCPARMEQEQTFLQALETAA